MKVTIVIPTYKRPDLLDRLLASIVLQTYQTFEVLVIDDNSPNELDYEIVIGRYKSLIPELHFLSNDTNSGAPYSRNRGIIAAKYDLIALVDDDDEWLPAKLEEQVNIFKHSDERVGIVYTWTDAIDENGAITHRYRGAVEGNAIREILTECFIPSPSVMVRKKVIIDAGLFDESFPSCQDWDMWTRIFAKGYEARVVSKVLTLYHRQTSNSIGTSVKARFGYSLYYRKHFWRLLCFGKFRHLARFVRMVSGI